MSNSSYSLDPFLRGNQNIISSLEEKYKHRNLKFTSAFEGIVPVQAYGKIDNLYFYFRLRGDAASLIVGSYDDEIEEARYQENINQTQKFLAETGITDISFINSEKNKIVKPTGLEKNYYPSLVWFENKIVTDEKTTTYLDIFSKLVDTLKSSKKYS